MQIQNKQERLQTLTTQREQEENQKSKVIKLTSNKSVQLVASKFIKEYENVVQEVVGNIHEPAIDYIKLGEVLKRLSFTQNQGDFESSNICRERSLIYDIWYLLKGEKYGGITRRNLCQFFLALIGCAGLSLFCEPIDIQSRMENGANVMSQDDNGEQFQYDYSKRNMGQQPQKNEDPTYRNNYSQNSEFNEKLQQMRQNNKQFQIGFFDEYSNWCINEDEGKQIQSYFDLLYRNRLSGETLKKFNPQEQEQYQPQINKNSKKLAEQYRERLLEETAILIENKQIDVQVPENGKISHVDLLLYQKKAQEHLKTRKKIEEQEEQLKECSFQPKILNSSIHSKELTNRNPNDSQSIGGQKSGIQKSMELFQLAKPASQKQDRNARDIEYEKSCDECTFQPDLVSQKKLKEINTIQVVAKDIDKTIERMKMARSMKQAADRYKTRGYHAIPSKDELLGNKLLEIDEETKKSKSFKKKTSEDNRSSINSNSHQNSKQIKSSSLQVQPDKIQTNQNFNQQMQTNQIQDNLNEEENMRIPLLFVDVNLGPDKTSRIVVYEGDTAKALARKFAIEYTLDKTMESKLEELLDYQISGLLTRIDEEEIPSLNSDRDENNQ